MFEIFRIRTFKPLLGWDECSACSTKLEEPSDIYCAKHRGHCARCSKVIEKSKVFCDKHGKCSQAFCLNWKVNYSDYCAKHTVNYSTPKQCVYEISTFYQERYKCQREVITADGYCSQHENKCEECSERMPVCTFSNYCVRHSNSCANCSARIYRSENYCSNCEANNRREIASQQEQQQIQERQQKTTEQNQLKSLVKAKTSIGGEIAEVERFSPWFSPNCATVITSAGNYLVYLVVYEPVREKMEKVIAPIKINGNYYSFSSAQAKATNLRANLANSSNPILEVFPNADSWNSFSGIVSWPYVKKENLPVGYIYPPRNYFSSDDMIGGSDRLIFNDTAGENMPIANYLHGQSPDKYIKPGDIVWIWTNGNVFPNAVTSYYHVCVYLGNEKVCHILNKEGAKIQNWKEFIKSGGRVSELIRFHPIIPFKNYKTIAENIAWANFVGFRNKDNSLSYSITNRNCEHFANMAVLGINYSGQIDSGTQVALRLKRFVDNFAGESNNGKGSTIELTNEINESNNILGKLNNRESQEIEARIEQAKPNYIPTDNCRIM